MMNYSVTKNGKPLDKSLYKFDEDTSVFTSDEECIDLDFSLYNSVVFNVCSDCNIKAGSYCVFNTGSNCIFQTGSSCKFNTGLECMFSTGFACMFRTGSRCTFNTLEECFFNTGSECKFNTGHNCTFNTAPDCTFNIKQFSSIITAVNVNLNIYEQIIVFLKDRNKTKVYNINEYYHENIKGLCVNNEDLDRLKEFDLDNPRSSILHINDPLGKKLFEHFKKTKVL